jgi:hypothetical protein
MNAVERLLGQGEQVLSLFDEMYRERIGASREESLPDVPVDLIYAVGHIVIDAMPPGRYWSSGFWLQAAAEAAWLEMKKPGKNPTKQQIASRTADLYRDYLAKREQILAPETWRRMLADVVFESREWSPLSEKVVSLAEQVAAAVQRVERLSCDIEPMEWSKERVDLRSGSFLPAHRADLRDALDLLHPYAQPPKPATLNSEKKTRGSRGRGGRNRKGIGGRPKVYPATLVRKVVAAREKYEKTQKRLKRRILPRSQWLFDYCGEEDIDTRSTFPSKDPKQPEAWDVRAERFWRAANKRLRESGN